MSDHVVLNAQEVQSKILPLHSERIISTNKNEITAGGSDIARKEEQGSNCKSHLHLHLIPQLQNQLQLPVDWH
eukprot:scaffold7494_cov210-Skeletonema_menzelii.AAC.2